MKRLSLKNLNLGVDSLLQREQLKTVFGGYGGNSITCPPGYYACCNINSAPRCYKSGTTHNCIGSGEPTNCSYEG